MAEPKTTVTDVAVDDYLGSLDEPRRSQCSTLCEIMRTMTGDEGSMYGPAIAGFGRTSYSTADGKEHNWFTVGFSSRKQGLSVYLMGSFESRERLLEELGKYKAGKSCLNIPSLDYIHLPTLKKLIRESDKATKAAGKR
ncbi:MAG: DUF1801 domain-containing protein [Phycisphaerales bacterium]